MLKNDEIKTLRISCPYSGDHVVGLLSLLPLIPQALWFSSKWQSDSNAALGRCPARLIRRRDKTDGGRGRGNWQL